MVIVKICGGLGNQLFQYALYRKILEQGKEAKLDLSWYQIKKRNQQRAYKLSQFSTEENVCTKREKNKLANATENRKQRLVQKIIGQKHTHICEESPYTFEPTILQKENVYLDGYWQTEKYFLDIKNILVEELVLNSSQSVFFNKIEKKIVESNSISVHIRRGDYLSEVDTYGNICTEEYYRKAMKYFETIINDSIFFIFSDDIIWAKETFKDKKNLVFIDDNKKDEEEKDLILMSKCKHNIIANSSFSWWAAWLNSNNNKIVIGPKKWVNKMETPDIWCKEWILM